MINWECNLCGSWNGEWRVSCKLCSTWVCKYCTLHNNPNDLHCSGCNRLPLGSISSPARANLIDLTADELETAGSAIELHSNPKQFDAASKLEDNVDTGKLVNKWKCNLCATQNLLTVINCRKCFAWICRRCSFHNDPYHRKCETCSTRFETDDPNAAAEMCRIRELCLESNEKFTDAAFPPNASSLGKSQPPGNKSGPARVNSWVRLSEMIRQRGSTVLWATLPTSDDVRQGPLGDCWLLASIALIANRPDLLRKVLISTMISAEGACQFKLCRDGRWIVVTIDDFLPVDANGCLAFAQPNHRNFWVPLLEKACAKFCGDYETLIGGFPAKALEWLTGVPCLTYFMPGASHDYLQEGQQFDADDVWAKLVSGNDAGFLLSASTKPEAANGLHKNHAYSILDLMHLDNFRLIQLRNPWGHGGRWAGEWSDFRLSRSARDEDDGRFWISYDDFMQQYEFVDVCLLRLGWQEQRIHGGLNDDLKILRLTVLEKGEIEIVVHQDRSWGEDKLNMVAWLCGLSPEDHEPTCVVDCSKDPQRRSWVKFCSVLEPGQYAVCVGRFLENGVDWASHGTIVCWSARSSLLEKVDDPHAAYERCLAVFKATFPDMFARFGFASAIFDRIANFFA